MRIFRHIFGFLTTMKERGEEFAKNAKGSAGRMPRIRRVPRGEKRGRAEGRCPKKHKTCAVGRTTEGDTVRFVGGSCHFFVGEIGCFDQKAE